MKKFYKKIVVIITFVFLLVVICSSCNGATTKISSDDSTQNTDDTSIKAEPNNSNEKPYNNVVLERNGYDIISAGEYYGLDFESLSNYGTYYRIIDNYTDFSKLTEWGKEIDESIFNESFVLVLYSYKNHIVYYSHPSYYKLNGPGQFSEFDKSLESNCLTLRETWTISTPGALIDGNQMNSENCRELIPANVKEIIYLLIPKSELPLNVPVNGEIELYNVITEDV